MDPNHEGRGCRQVNTQQTSILLCALLSYRQVFKVLELMHMDMANCTISTMRPFIRQQACEYEREKFDKLLEVQRRRFTNHLNKLPIFV